MIRVDACNDALFCEDACGFVEALEAAIDPSQVPPHRLVLVRPNEQMTGFLDEWSEDVEHVRRTLTLCRVADGEEVTLVATIASHGRGVDTSLSLDSVRTAACDELARSGVHPRVLVEAALARLDALESIKKDEPSP